MVIRDRAASATRLVDDAVEILDRQRCGQRHRQQRQPRRGTHRRQIAEIHRQRAVTDCRRRGERAIEVDAVDEGVDAEDLQAVARRLDDRRIVADADRHPGGRGGKPSADAGDELGS